MSIFGSPKKFLVDNDGEFNNEDFSSLCENVNIHILPNAAESPWSNGLIERHNAIVGYTVTKAMEDADCDLELTLSWAVAAKNSLKNANGFSPNQLVLRGNPNYPTVLNLKLPALEEKSFSEVVASNINAIHAARQAFIQSESVTELDMPYNIKPEPLGMFITLLEILYIIKGKIIVSGMGKEQSLGRMVNKFQSNMEMFMSVFIHVEFLMQ